jgi:hypothetical protein
MKQGFGLLDMKSQILGRVYQTSRHIPENCILNIHRHENLKLILNSVASAVLPAVTMKSVFSGM